MPDGDGLSEPEDEGSPQVSHHRHAHKTSEDAGGGKGRDEEETEDEEEEPRLKYATLTRHTSSVYRSGDALSACLVAGDKLIVGTHNGHIHVFNLPTFNVLKVYHAHKASVSSVSISPFPPPVLATKLDAAQRLAAESAEERTPTGSPGAKQSPRQPQVPRLPSNQIYIATSSIDGNVCIQSLVDPNDVQLRNFGRPVQSVALSPEYKSDRSYLSGGQAGSLVLTTGGQSGRSANATTTSATAAATGWLGSIGLGSNTGTDRVLHSGEGAISTIQWSLSGRYVAWVNEQGIKIMRSNVQSSSAEYGMEWQRFSHIDRPPGPIWEEMAGVWKARATWVNRENLEVQEEVVNGDTFLKNPNTPMNRFEELCIGWGDAAWIIRVFPESLDSKRTENAKAARANVVTLIRFDDCTICGISLYTPDLLLILAHMEKKTNSKKSAEISRKGRQHKRNALEPELRLIDINSKEEVEADTLTISRFESLTPSDYHLTMLPPTRLPVSLAQKGYLAAGVGAIGSGIETVGQGVWDVTMYGPRKLGADRLFSGNESVRSSPIGPNQVGTAKGANNYLTGWIPGFGSSTPEAAADTPADVAISQSMKIFMFSPYDCIVAVKRNLADRVKWLTDNNRFQEAWELLDQHPEAAGLQRDLDDETPSTPSKASSFAQSGSTMSQTSPARIKQKATLAEFFEDSASNTSSRTEKNRFPAARKEKQRIGELWLQQLRQTEKWVETAEVAAKVLETSDRWEYWIWEFIRNQKFDEITPVIPTFQLQPPLPSSTFEIVLGHYVATDRLRFKELIDQWPSDIFEISSITSAIQDQLDSGNIAKGSQDWTLLQEALAKLHVADGHFKEALQCYVRLQDADTAMTLLREHHLVDVVADDIRALVLIRIPESQLKSASQDELQELSSDSIKFLVDEATQGIVEPEEVVSQLEDASLPLFLFFYLRALWRGGSTTSTPRPGLHGTSSLDADRSKAFVEQFADRAVELFAEYDRELLMEFLHVSTAYTFDKAVKVCESRQYINELVYLLSKTGDLRKALFLIIDDLKDVSKAIAFAKAQNDKGLWDDLLDYSMSRPRFISGLLAEVGTAIDPITLLKRIPSGLEVEGLKDGLKKMIREYDLQDSISEGVARVLSSEVAVGMETLRRGRRRGLKFDVTTGAKKTRSREVEALATQGIQQTPPKMEDERRQDHSDIDPGHCAACHRPFPHDETETLVGFACGHVYHVSHLLHDPSQGDGDATPPPEREQQSTDDALFGTFKRTIGLKVTNARLLRDRIAKVGGCRICKREREGGLGDTTQS